MSNATLGAIARGLGTTLEALQENKAASPGTTEPVSKEEIETFLQLIEGANLTERDLAVFGGLPVRQVAEILEGKQLPTRDVFDELMNAAMEAGEDLGGEWDEIQTLNGEDAAFFAKVGRAMEVVCRNLVRSDKRIGIATLKGTRTPSSREIQAIRKANRIALDFALRLMSVFKKRAEKPEKSPKPK